MARTGKFFIVMRTDLVRDPAVSRMAKICGFDRLEIVVGYLHSVWCWFAEESNGGVVSGMTLDDLGDLFHLHGFPQAMVEVGWLKEWKDDFGVPHLLVTNWDRWFSGKELRRQFERERKRRQRMSRTCPGQSMGHFAPTETETETETETGKKDLFGDPKKNGKFFRPESAKLPFASEAFEQAWFLYCVHREEIRKPLTPAAVANCLRELADWGEARAVAAINHTIARGWQGIREPDKRATADAADLAKAFLDRNKEKR